MDDNCVFCKILNNELDSYKIYEDDDCAVILDKFPNNIGHCLIIPRRHVQNIFELDNNLSGKLLKIAAKIANAIQKSLKPDGIHLLQNNGKGANQTVNHFHMHVIPRYFDDTVEIKWVNNKFNDDEFVSTLNKIKEFI